MYERACKLLKFWICIGFIGFIYYILWVYFHIGIKCPMNTLFNLDCGFCGLTRMCLSLLNLDVVHAFEVNKAVFVLLPLFSYYVFIYCYRYVLYGIECFRKNEEIVLWLCFIAIMIFGVVRNVI